MKGANRRQTNVVYIKPRQGKHSHAGVSEGKAYFLASQIVEAAVDGMIRVVAEETKRNIPENGDRPKPVLTKEEYSKKNAEKILLDYAAKNKLSLKGLPVLLLNCDVNAKDKDGATAWMLAARAGNSKIALALKAKGADVNVKMAGQTILENAVLSGSVKDVEKYVVAGADLETRYCSGMTPLMVAVIASDRNFDVIKTLIRAGADLSAKLNGQSVFEMALLLQTRSKNTLQMKPIVDWIVSVIVILEFVSSFSDDRASCLPSALQSMNQLSPVTGVHYTMLDADLDRLYCNALMVFSEGIVRIPEGPYACMIRLLCQKFQEAYAQMTAQN